MLNKYFESSWNTDDNNLFADLVQECIQIHGREYYYLPRELTDLNTLLGEDTTSSNFNSAIKLEMYLVNVTNWTGENTFISKFGFEQHDEGTLAIDKRRFLQEVTSKHPNIKLPREGDLIVFPQEIDRRHRIYEISFVNPEPVFYQLGRLYYYEITVRVFNHTHEQFDTDIPEIDKFNHQELLTHTVELDIERTQSINPNLDFFNSGDEIIHGNSFSATVVLHDENQLTLSYNENTYNEIKGEFAMLDNRDKSVTDIPLISIDNPNVQWYIKHNTDTSRQNKKSNANKFDDGLTNEIVSLNGDDLIYCEKNKLLQ